MKKKFLVVGRSGSGKSSIVREVASQLDLKVVKSYTTRPPRPEELAGNTDHYFISDEEVEQFKDDMAAYTEINGYKYFATKSEVDQCDIYVIDPNGVEDLKSRCGDEFKFITIYIRTSPDIAKKRAEKRGDDPQVYQSRIEKEDSQFKKFEHDMPWQFHILNNHSFEEAVETMKKFIRTELHM